MTHDHSTSIDIVITCTEFTALRADYANLLAAARATLTATIDGEPHPLAYLVDELAAQGQLPPQVREQYGSDPLAPWLDHRDNWAQR
jgi:hypothetical protein